MDVCGVLRRLADAWPNVLRRDLTCGGNRSNSIRFDFETGLRFINSGLFVSENDG